ncbi:hypothetical protein NQ315_006407 [Exocentrus adspersus]|uniref:Sensory neuron membrane protein 2 n=1 Tax=Exocentrus adspersus TaxID=1586481 RepID=A0AAV8W048_9CUCU|nr:hypothetical protein NQ315_006407 [Exocentrus adspersus]
MVRKTFCSIKVLFITTAALVVLFVAVLVLAFIGVPRLINSQLEKQVHLEKGTTQWDRFVEIPFALDFKIWLFNVTNPEEIVTGAKPVLKEIGPFYYTFTIKKNIISTNPSDDTVTYDRDMTFTYNQELSGSLKEDEELVFLNPVMLSISQMSSLIERMALNGCLDKIFPSQYNDIFIKTKVRTMFFDGYEFAVKNDDIGVACGIIRNKIIEKTAAVRTIDRIYKNGEVYSLKFAYFHYKESKTDGVYTVFRGLDDVSLLGQVFRWNDEPQLSFWGRAMSVNNETCNRVRGTDATIFQPFINKDSVVEIYNTDICR